MASNLEMTLRVKNKVRVKRKMTRKQQGILTLLKCFDGFLIDRVSRVFFIGLNYVPENFNFGWITALPRPRAHPLVRLPFSCPLAMAPRGGPEAPPPPLPPNIEAFRKMVAACNKRPASDSQ
jgi:hypothetical protein